MSWNKVRVGDVRTGGVDRDLRQDDVGSMYQNPNGREVYLVIRLEEDNDEMFRLVSLEWGNRWNDSGELPGKFQLIPPNTTITITVGG